MVNAKPLLNNNIPQNTDAEEWVIGSCIIDSSALEKINPQLDAGDFFSERNSVVFSVMLYLQRQNIGINELTLAEELKKQGKVDLIGGLSCLAHYLTVCGSPLEIEYYANIVRENSILRYLLKAADQIKTLVSNSDHNLSGTLAKADELILNVRKHGVPSPIITPINRAIILNERYNKLHDNPNGIAVSTKIGDLDYRLGGGLFQGDVMILAGRTGIGKTTMVQTLANNISVNNIVLLCSAEMTVDGLSDRDVAGLVGVPTNIIRRGKYSDEVYDKIIDQGLPKIEKRKLYFYRDIPLTTDRILQACVTMKLRYGLDVVVIDYLGMLDDEYGHSQYERIGYISRRIKQIAIKINVPIILLHQLNRDVEGRNDKRPMLSDLRDSGKVEEDADIVCFLYRDDYYNPNLPEESRITEFIIAKNRQGESNQTVSLKFSKTKQQYYGLGEEA